MEYCKLEKGRKFIGMTKQAIQLTNPAQDHIIEILSQSNSQCFLLGINNKGCSGNSYTFDLIDTQTINKFDEVIDLNGYKVVISASSLLNLLGSTLDYQKDIFGGQFVWQNPHVINKCGCGTSVEFKKC